MHVCAARSDVWNFFTKNGNKAKCSLCEKELSYCGGTSNLCDHLNRVHQNEYHPPKRNQATIEGSTRGFSRSKRITDLTIALYMRPIRLVEI